LLTTHYLDEAAHLGDRAGIIAGGKLIDIGTIDAIGGADARVPLVRWVDGGVSREQRTSEPSTLVARLVRENGGAELDGLEVVRPSLEDIYLELVAAYESERIEPVEIPVSTSSTPVTAKETAK
jgi:ABC-2 type transport system ATP-binding protein